ncbi:MAG TPA: SDR family oxidoreductase, partial [Hyphomicrobiaceae bacterium]|nr:SDR family oxidoreductase [Hyphomicrobiaceae bacterium]
MAQTSDWLGMAGRVAVVTGGASGIGRATAKSLAAAGARVAVLDINQKGAEEVAKEVGGGAIAVACDSSSEAAIAAAAKAVAGIGGADILVNNAGILKPGGLDKLSLADWNAIIAVNLTGYFLMAQAFGAQMMAKRRGSIVHVASIAGQEPQTFSGAYSVTKAGVVMLSRQLAVEWGPAGIRSNVVSPGLIRTPLSESFYRQPGVTEKRSAIVPRQRVGTAEDIANSITFLASDKSDYVNGAEILTDGGVGSMLMTMIPRPGFERP